MFSTVSIDSSNSFSDGLHFCLDFKSRLLQICFMWEWVKVANIILSHATPSEQCLTAVTNIPVLHSLQTIWKNLTVDVGSSPTF